MVSNHTCNNDTNNNRGKNINNDNSNNNNNNNNNNNLTSGPVRIYTSEGPHCGTWNILPLRGWNAR